MKKPKPLTTAWQVGGIVPPGCLEPFLLTMLQMGVKPNECTPALFNGAHESVVAETPKLLPAPRKSRRAPSRLRDFLLQVLSRGPKTRAELREIVDRETDTSPRSMDPRLNELKKQNLIILNNGVWSLVDQPQPQPVQRRHSRFSPGPGQQDTVLEFLRAAHPQSVKLGELEKHFVKKKMRTKSASVALTALVKKGFAERVAPATYAYKPKENAHAAS